MRWLRHLLGYVEVEDANQGFGTPWPPHTTWMKRKDIPPWGPHHYGREDQCQVRMRAPGAISSWFGCDGEAGHEGTHREDVELGGPNGAMGHHHVTFTTEAAIESWQRRPDIVEMKSYEAGLLPGVTWWQT